MWRQFVKLSEELQPFFKGFSQIFLAFLEASVWRMTPARRPSNTRLQPCLWARLTPEQTLVDIFSAGDDMKARVLKKQTWIYFFSLFFFFFFFWRKTSVKVENSQYEHNNVLENSVAVTEDDSVPRWNVVLRNRNLKSKLLFFFFF